jgi:Dynactin complex subunit involved in mitotic spindle partitioning in anaphase B
MSSITCYSEYGAYILRSLTTDEGDSNNSFGSRRDLHRIADTPPPDWVVLGESVLIRPYNSSGVIAYIGGTDFSGGTWIGVELDAPTGECYQVS